MKRRRFIYPYSYFRILMIFNVVVFHWRLFLPEGFHITPGIDGFGAYSVAFFFLLTGFLMMKNASGKDDKDFSYKEEVKQVLRRRSSYLIKYEIAILLSVVYYLLIHILTGQHSLSEIIISGITDILFVSTLINPESLTMNACWFFQCLVQFWVLSPLIIKGWKTLKDKLIANPAVYTAVLVLFQISYFVNLRLISSITDPYLNSLVRIYEIMVGMSIYELVTLTNIDNKTVVSGLELVGLGLLVYPMYRLPVLDNLLSYHGVCILLCMIIIFAYAYGTGFFSTYLLRKNDIIEHVSAHVFDIFIFHFTVFHYASLSPRLSSPYLLLLEGLVLSYLAGILIDRVIAQNRVRK